MSRLVQRAGGAGILQPGGMFWAGPAVVGPSGRVHPGGMAGRVPRVLLEV